MKRMFQSLKRTSQTLGWTFYRWQKTFSVWLKNKFIIAAKQFWCICHSIPQSLYIQACTGDQLRVVLKIMSGWFSFYFRVCFCKLKKEHSELCDWWDLTKWHRKRRKAAETENTRKGKNLNSEFLEPPLCLRNTKKRRGFSTLSASVPRPAFEIIKVVKMWVKRKMQKNTAI